MKPRFEFSVALTRLDQLPELEARIDGKGGDDWVFDSISEGDYPREVMAKVRASRRMFYYWLDAKDGRRAEYKRAHKKGAADHHAEKSIEVLEEVQGFTDKDGKFIPPSSAEVSLAGMKSKWHQWRAGLMSDEYKDEQQALVQVNIADLHLDALREVGGPVRQLKVVEAKMIEDGS